MGTTLPEKERCPIHNIDECMCESHADAELPSICGKLVLEKDQCIVAFAENGTGYIIARSDDIAANDILMEDTTEGNNFDSIWDQGLVVGMYLLRVSPWSVKSYEGEYDCGIDVTECTPLWKVES